MKTSIGIGRTWQKVVKKYRKVGEYSEFRFNFEVKFQQTLVMSLLKHLR